MSQAAHNRQETAIEESDFIRDVRRGLGNADQKQLPPKYFYDDVGSALFEVITLLPEYGLTRADERLIEQYAGEIVGHLSSDAVAAELGSGAGTKTRRILTEMSERGPTEYFPIDISVGALERCQAELGLIDDVRVTPLASSYLDGLREVATLRSNDTQLLVLFLGSTIGNFDRDSAQQFLSDIRSVLGENDMLLLGTDLVKPTADLLAAYDDPTGVTAAFNKNVLARINRELGGDFDLTAFEHTARYNDTHRRVEIHLRATRHTRVHIQAANLTIELESGETIWTESSHKFRPEEVTTMGANSAFRSVAQWVDREWAFAETLLVAE